MKTIHFWPALGLFVLGPADAQVRVAPFPEEKVQAIQQAARAYYDANKIRGMSVAVGYQGRLVYSKGFGLANIKPTYVNGDTIFRLASVSKPVTAILAMALADQGKLDIDKTTRGYFTQLPSLHKHRVRHILTHMSGIRHYIGNDPCSAQNAWFSQMTDASKLFWKDPLLFAPGTKFDYSTHAFTILGGALERATGRTYGQLIERQIAIPNGVPSLKVENRNVPNPRRTDLFTFQGGNLIQRINNPDNISWKSPGGGLEASANDLCRLGMKLLSGQVLKASTLTKMFTRQRFDNQTTGEYGLGWRVANHLGETVGGHSGEQTGAASYWRVYPQSKLVVVVLTNTRQNDPRELAVDISEIVLSGSLAGEPDREEAPVEPGTLAFVARELSFR
jgi:CubicO group peptidase (beta-lactamase class C family)